MKVFICLLALVAAANAGLLFGLDSVGGNGYGGGFDGGHNGGYGGGYDSGHGGQASIIKVIHEEHAAPAAHYSSAPAIIKVIHEEDHHQHHNQYSDAAPHYVQVIHEGDHHQHHDVHHDEGHHQHVEAAPHFVQVVHGGYHYQQHHQHLEAEPHILQVVHEEQVHFDHAPAPDFQHVNVGHEQAYHGHSHDGGFEYSAPAQIIKIIKVIQQQPDEHHHVDHYQQSQGWQWD